MGYDIVNRCESFADVVLFVPCISEKGITPDRLQYWNKATMMDHAHYTAPVFPTMGLPRRGFPDVDNPCPYALYHLPGFRSKPFILPFFQSGGIRGEGLVPYWYGGSVVGCVQGDFGTFIWKTRQNDSLTVARRWDMSFDFSYYLREWKAQGWKWRW